MKTNYQLILDQTLSNLKGVPTLLLHSCCAPCSSYVLEYLSQYFKITILYYNPNITPESEYQKRLTEVKRLVEVFKTKYPVEVVAASYEPDVYFEAVKGLEKEPERGQRCFKCYELRLTKTAEYAKKHHFDYFTTTLSISPYKNSDWINEIGLELENHYQVKYLVADFKKRNGYKRSIELSHLYHLYRQNNCGCIFSKQNKIKE